MHKIVIFITKCKTFVNVLKRLVSYFISSDVATHSESLSLTGVKLVGSCTMCFTVELLFDKPIAVSVTETDGSQISL